MFLGPYPAAARRIVEITRALDDVHDSKQGDSGNSQPGKHRDQFFSRRCRFALPEATVLVFAAAAAGTGRITVDLHSLPPNIPPVPARCVSRSASALFRR